MRAYRSEFIQAFVDRGFMHQATDLDALDQLAATERLTAYIGFDATADSLHVGNLVGIMMLRLLQKTGHRPIALVGGGTSKVGDPSGKDEGRQLLTDEALARNLEGIKRSLSGFLEIDAAGDAGLMVNNADWLDHLNYIQLLRDYGQHFTINRMLTFDSVKLRLDREQPLTFLEFNYMIMQAYDFVELARRHGCVLQMGGSDQWGNIVNGVELGRRADGRTLFGLTSPLITTASGAKMGKSVAGAVWLNPERLSDFDYWQYWRNTEDADVGRFLKLFTDLPLGEIGKLEALAGAEINEAKKVMAGSQGCRLGVRSRLERSGWLAHGRDRQRRAGIRHQYSRSSATLRPGDQQGRSAPPDPRRWCPAEQQSDQRRRPDGRRQGPARRRPKTLLRQKAPHPRGGVTTSWTRTVIGRFDGLRPSFGASLMRLQ